MNWEIELRKSIANAVFFSQPSDVNQIVPSTCVQKMYSKRKRREKMEYFLGLLLDSCVFFSASSVFNQWFYRSTLTNRNMPYVWTVPSIGIRYSYFRCRCCVIERLCTTENNPLNNTRVLFCLVRCWLWKMYFRMR